jgi:hypothetical protein
MAKQITLNGKKFEVSDVSNDLRFVTALSITQDENSTDEARFAAFSRVFALFFGDASKALEVEDAWAAEHDGTCDAGEFLQYLTKAAAPKN